MAHARMTDPSTSHLAAASVKNETLTKRVILNILNDQGMTDEELVQMYNFMSSRIDTIPRASDSGIRSRRAELTRDFKVFAVGYKKTKSGRKAIVWQAG